MNPDMIKKIQMLENVFSDYLMGKINISTMDKKLSIILSGMKIGDSDKHFEISTINNTKEPFFGMRVFPVVNEMQKVVQGITEDRKSLKDIYKVWKNIENWYIEIDSNVFKREVINLTPKEITSLLLHEVGHVVRSDSVLERFYRAYQESYVRMKLADKSSLKFLYSLYMIPLSVGCSIRDWTNGRNEIKQEMFADKVLVEHGYTEDLISAIGKIIRAYGNSIIPSSEDEKDKEIEASIKWCNLNITDLIRRKNKLKDDLFYQTIKSNSNFMKALSMKLLNDLGLNLRESYSGAVVESSIELICQKDFVHKYNSSFDLKKISSIERLISSAMESANNQIALEAMSGSKKKFPSQYDIDCIFVEIDRISNQHDRIYVLDLIYNKIEEIEHYKELMEYNSDLRRKYSAKAEDMLNQLNEMRKAVLSKRKFNSSYKLFVKYPEGYEG